MTFPASPKRNRSNITPLFTASARGQQVLPLFERTPLTSLHLVGEDWFTGMTSWPDRSSAGNNATPVGTPLRNGTFGFDIGGVPKSVFRGRNFVTCGNSPNGMFYAPGETVGPSTRRTYEMVFEGCEVFNGRALFGNYPNTGFRLVTGTLGTIKPLVVNSAGGVHLGNVNITMVPSTAYTARVVHVVFDMLEPSIRTYVNGSLVQTALGPASGSLTPYSGNLGIACLIQGTTVQQIGYSVFLEFLRHEEIFTPKMIKQRVARFAWLCSALKVRGY